MFCQKCGKNLDDKAIYCPNCGHATNKNNTSEEIKKVFDYFGIISIVLSIFIPIAGLVLGIFGLNLSKDETNKKCSIVGIIIGSIRIVLNILLIIFFIMLEVEFINLLR